MSEFEELVARNWSLGEQGRAELRVFREFFASDWYAHVALSLVEEADDFLAEA